MSKKSNRTVTAICVGIVVLALAVVLLSVLSPVLAARKALRVCKRELREAKDISYVSVLDPLDRSGNFLPADEEARLTEPQVIGELRDRLLGYMDGAKYGGVEEAIGGNWDIRVRFADTELIDIYLHEDYFYLSQNGHKFVFTPADAEEYTAGRSAWLDELFDVE